MKYFLTAAVLFNLCIASAQTPVTAVGRPPAKKSAPAVVEQKPEVTPEPIPVNLLSKPHSFLHIYSEPEGAEIWVVENGKFYGRAFLAKKYTAADFEEHKTANGCVYHMKLEARWVSGAKSVSKPIEMCRGTSVDYQYTFTRPKDAPFLERDENYATALREKREKEDRYLGQFKVVVKTVPEGAEVFEQSSSGRKSFGRAPVALEYDIGAFKRIAATSQDGCMSTIALAAEWPSGVRSTAEKMRICGEVKNGEVRVIERPADAPGLQVDQNFAAALILERIRKENNDQQSLQIQRAQEQAIEAQQRMAQETQRQAQQEASDSRAATLINSFLLGVTQGQAAAPIVIERRQAPTELRCVTKPRFGRLDTVCE